MTIERLDIPAITDPAAAAAAAKCWLARSPHTEGTPLERMIGAHHPRVCEWCHFPLQTLIDYLVEFNAWAGFVADHHGERYTEPEVRRFQSLDRAEQRRRVHRAAYGDA